LVTARAGDLILWDSRCVHCNTPALSALNREEGGEGGDRGEGEEEGGERGEEREEEGAEKGGTKAPTASETAPAEGVGELIRSVGYVCMTPAAWATDEVLRLRQEAYVRETYYLCIVHSH
jgi:hypothetical protein